MMILLTYDVDMRLGEGTKRLRKVAKVCENYGVRVQNSVFELLIDATQLVVIKNQLIKIIDSEKDSIRFYRLGGHWENKIEILGIEKGIRQNETLIL